MLLSAQEEERLQGLKALGQRWLEVEPEIVLRALGDQSWRVRKEAVQLFLEMPRAAELAGEVIELLHSQDNAGLRNAAVEILVRLGSPTVPYLVEELSCSDHDVRKFVLDILGDIGDESCVQAMLPALSDPDENVRAAAAENLGKLRAAEAVPMLLEAMAHADLWMRFTILEAFARIGAVVPVARLVEYSDQKLLRKALFDCLGRVGGLDALPLLLDGLTDDMRNVREAAVVALGRIADAFPEDCDEALSPLAGTEAVEAVAATLDSPDPAIGRAALRLLRGTGDVRYAARLLALLDHEKLHEEAAAALVGMGPRVACSLLALWTDANTRTRAYIAYIIGEAGCLEGVPLLCGGLNDPEPDLQLVCAQALGKTGSAEAVKPLVELLENAQEEVREVATQALCRLGRLHSAAALSQLRPLLAADDAELRMHVISIFGQMDGPETERCLALAMKDESPLVRRSAVRACDGRTGENPLQTLMLALTDEDAEVRRLAVESIGMTGDCRATSPLQLALQDEDIWVRAASVRALGHLREPEAFPLICQALGDPVGLVAIAALESLAAIDFDRSLPLMVNALRHGDEEVVNTALSLLAASGRRDWLPDAVEPLLNHRHWEIRSAFVRILATLEGPSCRTLLEGRLLLEGEELVRQLIQDILGELREIGG